jgi:outer membrane protein OmpA-like peptidoglycan-associated protein
MIDRMKHAISLLFFFMLAISLTAQQFAPRYELVKLGKQVNTHYHEAAPIISQDGKKLYFFVHNHPENTFGKEGSDDIWVSSLDEKGEWGVATHLSGPFNNHHSNQVFTALPDGSLFIKGGRGKDSKGFSIISGGGSMTELDVPGFKEMNKGKFYGASISSDAKHMILFFGQTPAGPRSGLYVSNAEANGKWSVPRKLNISVRDDDFGPFIAPDDQTLYFASDRNVPGKHGKADIYKTTRLDDTWQNWSAPVNMSPPINTAADEFYFCIDKSGNVFNSRANSTQDGGNLDIFKLVPRNIKVMISGTVYNEKTQQAMQANVVVTPSENKPLNLRSSTAGKFETRIPEVAGYTINASQQGFLSKDLSFTLPQFGNDTTLIVEIFLTPIAKKLILTGTVYDSKTNNPLTSKLDITLKTDRKTNYKLQAGGGKYEQEIQKLGWYMFTASAQGYLNASDSVEVLSEEMTPVIKDLFLQPIEVGLTVRLKNIYFDFDKTTLKKESFVELNKVVDFLKGNPHVEIEISGHTDSKGSDEYNLNLSQGRSQSVVDYIISQGIEDFRLTAHGYGETNPIETNDTDAGRANNRRVEFTVVKK